MTEIINGKKIASEIALACKKEVDRLKATGITPALAIITYNPDSASRVYVSLKLKKAKEIGVECKLLDWSGKNQDECMDAMNDLAKDELINGIIIQLPANGLINEQALLDSIPANKDVDGLSNNPSKLVPATPKAILTLLAKSKIDLRNKKIAIVGQGKLVGKPLAEIMRTKGYDIDTADSSTKDLTSITKPADIIITAVGKPGLINGDMIKAGAVIIDAGTSEQNNALVGDVDYESVENIASKIAKVPGGVGPVTVMSLLQNVIEAAKNPQ